MPRNQEAWDRAQKFASDMYNFGTYIGITEGATHYHAGWMEKFPRWANLKGFTKTVTIDTHLFYRWENPKLLASR